MQVIIEPREKMRGEKKYCYFNVYWIFMLALIIRLLFSPNNYVDDRRYILLSNQILKGNFDLDVGILLSAPFFPYLLAELKYLMPVYWYELLFFLQILISSLCIFCIYEIGLILFNNKRIALLSAIIYTVYPDTFMYVRAIGQEVFFQSFLIFCIYFFIKFTHTNKYRDIIFSSVFFSFCFLTKSFILLWSPFIVLLIFTNKKLSLQNKITSSVIYTLICIIFTMPIGFYNLYKHNQYTLSSNGFSVMFWVGNSESAYTVGIIKKRYEQEVPDEFSKDTAFQMYNTAYLTNIDKYLNERKTWGSPSEVQEKFWRASVQWIESNPKKFLQLRAYYLFRFIFPGHRPPNASFISLAIIFLYSALLYFSAFSGLYTALKQDFQKHSWILTLWLTMLLFSTIFCTEIRFRTITIDSFLCLYAAFFIHTYFSTISKKRTFATHFSEIKQQ